MKAHPALSDVHEAFRDTMRRFVAREIAQGDFCLAAVAQHINRAA